MNTLDIAIPTFRPEGINRIEKMLLPPKEGVRYVVSWQEHEDTPIPASISNRKDVLISRLNLSGVSNNRNNALSKCTADIVLISDDDIIFKDDAFDNIIKAFNQRDDMDLGIFKMKYSIPKSYPREECDLHIPYPKGFYGSAVEIAFKREKTGNLRFWPGIGPGNDRLQTGEDELFLISAIKRGLKCRFINQEIGEHPSISTGFRVTPGILRGQGFIINIMYPFSWILRIPLKALRLRNQRKGKFLSSLKYLGNGAIFALKNYRKISREFR